VSEHCEIKCTFCFALKQQKNNLTAPPSGWSQKKFLPKFQASKTTLDHRTFLSGAQFLLGRPICNAVMIAPKFVSEIFELPSNCTHILFLKICSGFLLNLKESEIKFSKFERMRSIWYKIFKNRVDFEYFQNKPSIF
jgi:hypothetical protein